MPALIEQSHALIPEDLLSGRFGTGAGRQLTRGELRLWNPDRRQLPACHANQSRWCSMVCAETTTSAQCSGWPMRSCWNGSSSVACTSTYENAGWYRRHVALSTGCHGPKPTPLPAQSWPPRPTGPRCWWSSRPASACRRSKSGQPFRSAWFLVRRTEEYHKRYWTWLMARLRSQFWEWVIRST